jgi:hypothetical protein
LYAAKGLDCKRAKNRGHSIFELSTNQFVGALEISHTCLGAGEGGDGLLGTSGIEGFEKLR